MNDVGLLKSENIESCITNFLIFKNIDSCNELSNILFKVHSELSNFYILNDKDKPYHKEIKKILFKPVFLQSQEYVATLLTHKLFEFINANPLKIVFDNQYYKNLIINQKIYPLLFSKTSNDYKASKELVELKNINYKNLHEIVEILCLKNHKSILPCIAILYSSYEKNIDYIKASEEYFIKAINNFDTYEKFEAFMGEFTSHVYSEKKIYTKHRLKNFFYNLKSYIDDYLTTKDTSYIEEFYIENLNEKTKKYLIQYLDIYFTSSSLTDDIASEKKGLIDRLVSGNEKSLVENFIPQIIDTKNIIKI